jgi:sulfatase maturation enzyme AslB (radical SAM superfamily)
MLNDLKINQFFSDMKHVLSNTPVKKSPDLITINNDKQGEQRTNIIYLTTACNLRCEYCYEKDSREGLPDQINLTIEDIDKFLDEITQREVNQISTIVIMGGEPFLRFDLVKYIVLRTIQIPKKKGWGISLVTNGTLFSNKIISEFSHLMKLCERSKKTSLSLEVSYDGSGHKKRKWPDGSSSKKIVEESMNKLVKYQIPFKISYVIHDLNYTHVIEDIIRILETWSNIKGIMLGYAYQLLDESLGKQYVAKSIRSDLTPYLLEIYKIYKIPICDHVCKLCKICDKSNFVGNSYLSPTTGITYDKKRTEHEFRQF